MRCGLVVLAFVVCSCSTSASARPAWPRAATREVDGGESLAPRAAARTITAIVEDDRPADKAVADKPAAGAGATGPGAGATADKPAAGAAAAAAEEPITTEDIVIEIED